MPDRAAPDRRPPPKPVASTLPSLYPWPDGIRHSLAGLSNAFPDTRVTVEDLVTEGDRVVARWSFRATQRGEVLGIVPTGKRVTVKGMIFYGISEGGISEYCGSRERIGLLQRLDELPQP